MTSRRTKLAASAGIRHLLHSAGWLSLSLFLFHQDVNQITGCPGHFSHPLDVVICAIRNGAAIKRDLFRARILLKNPINFAFFGAIKSTSIVERIRYAYREPPLVRCARGGRGEDELTHPTWIVRKSFIAVTLLFYRPADSAEPVTDAR